MARCVDWLLRPVPETTKEQIRHELEAERQAIAEAYPDLPEDVQQACRRRVGEIVKALRRRADA